MKKEYQEKTMTKKQQAQKIQERIKQSNTEDKKAEKKGMYYTSGILAKEGENPLEVYKRKLQELQDEKECKKKEKENKNVNSIRII